MQGLICHPSFVVSPSLTISSNTWSLPPPALTSLVPRPHPLTRRNSMMNQGLGLAQTFATVLRSNVENINAKPAQKRYGYSSRDKWYVINTDAAISLLLTAFGNKPKKFDSVHQTVSRREARVGCMGTRLGFHCSRSSWNCVTDSVFCCSLTVLNYEAEIDNGIKTFLVISSAKHQACVKMLYFIYGLDTVPAWWNVFRLKYVWKCLPMPFNCIVIHKHWYYTDSKNAWHAWTFTRLQWRNKCYWWNVNSNACSDC